MKRAFSRIIDFFVVVQNGKIMLLLVGLSDFFFIKIKINDKTYCTNNATFTYPLLNQAVQLLIRIYKIY